jgi:hypothetical protein
VSHVALLESWGLQRIMPYRDSFEPLGEDRWWCAACRRIIGGERNLGRHLGSSAHQEMVCHLFASHPVMYVKFSSLLFVLRAVASRCIYALFRYAPHVFSSLRVSRLSSFTALLERCTYFRVLHRSRTEQHGQSSSIQNFPRLKILCLCLPRHGWMVTRQQLQSRGHAARETLHLPLHVQLVLATAPKAMQV